MARALLCVIAMSTSPLAACGNRDAPVPSTDLIQQINRAERRPASTAFRIEEVVIDGQPKRVIATDPFTRVTWEMPIPARAVLMTSIALKPEAWTQPGNGVLFRIGIAGGRAYEELLNRHVDPFHNPDDRRWIPIELDLGAYGGFKWSLFYQPSRHAWKVIFNTNPGPPGTNDREGDLPVWGEPVIAR